MSGSQFIHIETYSLASATQKKSKAPLSSKLTIAEVIGEVLRRDGSCPHVQHPQLPTLINGCHPDSLVSEIECLSISNKDPIGRAIRKDAQLLLAGVCSYPHMIGSPEFNQEDFDRWMRLSVEFLKSEYGDAYRCTVLHTDELYPHLHFYAVPPSIDGQVHIRSIHCGMAARDTVKDIKNQKGTGKQRTLLYRNAMRAFQDRYYELVGSRSGLLRVGPKVRRLTRDAWRLEKQAAQRLMDANLKIESVAQIAINAKKLLEKSNIEKAKNDRDAQVNQDAEFKLTSKKNLLDEREYALVERENKALAALHLQAQIPRFLNELDTLKAETNTESVNLHKLKEDTSTAQHLLHQGNEAIAAQKVQSRQLDDEIMNKIRVLASSMFSSSKLKYLLDKFDALKVAYSSLKVKFTALEAENERLKSNYQIVKTKNAELDKSHRELGKSLQQERYAAQFDKKKISKLQHNFTELFVAFKNGDKSYLDKYRRDKTSSLDLH